jgi:hypothetical protein
MDRCRGIAYRHGEVVRGYACAGSDNPRSHGAEVVGSATGAASSNLAELAGRRVSASPY